MPNESTKATDSQKLDEVNAAISYVLNNYLDGLTGGIEWLRKWCKGDAEAKEQLRIWAGDFG